MEEVAQQLTLAHKNPSSLSSLSIIQRNFSLFLLLFVSLSSLPFFLTLPSTYKKNFSFANAMDLDDWEYLSDDHLHRPDEKGNGKRLISSDSNCIIDMDYFQKFTDTQKKVKMDPIEVPISPNPVNPELPEPSPTHGWVVKEVISVDTASSQVFLRENEFADMKLDSPKSTDKGLILEIELGKPQLEEKEEGLGGEEKSDKGLPYLITHQMFDEMHEPQQSLKQADFKIIEGIKQNPNMDMLPHLVGFLQKRVWRRQQSQGCSTNNPIHI